MPDVNLILRYSDTRGDTVISTREITEMICNGVSVIFGPEGTCHTEAIVTQSRNIPMISYVRIFQNFEKKTLGLNVKFYLEKDFFFTC